MSIEEVLKKHTASWMEIPGVVGTGLGSCKEAPCIKVFTSGISPGSRKQIPDRVEGYPVVVEETGTFRPLG